MPNAIQLAQQYVPLLDETYRRASVTAVLDGASELVRQGANANELIIPKIDMSGLGDYSRNSGYVDGDVTLVNETVACNFDRGRMFSVDSVDNMETAGVAFGQLAGEFIRTKVAPELDAFRLATYATAAGASAAADLADGEAAVKAIRAAITEMDEAEVPTEGRYLYITPALHGAIDDLDTTKSKAVLTRFAQVIDVPQSRFYTAITQLSGGAGQEAGGFAKADGALDVNFMIVHKPAVIQFAKHIAPKIVTPEQNQNADAYKYGYRHVGIADVYENKLAGVYVHTKAAAAG